MSSKKKKANNKKSVEELVRLVGKELKDLRIRDSLRELQPLWERAKPKRWDEFTEDEQKAMAKEQAEAGREFIREQRFLRVKRFLQSIIKAKSDDANSKLFTTAEEILEFVVQYESNPSSVSSYEWNRLETILLTRCEALLKAELKAEQEHPDIATETELNTTPSIRWRIWTCVKRIPRWIYVLVLFLAALLTIFHYLGWF